GHIRRYCRRVPCRAARSRCRLVRWPANRQQLRRDDSRRRQSRLLHPDQGNNRHAGFTELCRTLDGGNGVQHPMKRDRVRLLLAVALLAGVTGNAFAAACLSNLGGGTANWNVAATWTSCNGGIPQPADTVQIRGGDTGTMNTTATVASLLVGSTAGNNTSTLTFAAGSSLTVGGDTTTSGNNSNRNGVINMAAGGTLVANGSPAAFAFGAGTETWT